jgi:hypothetical protein
MLIKALDEAMPVLEILDLSYVVPGPQGASKILGTPASKKRTDV